MQRSRFASVGMLAVLLGTSACTQRATSSAASAPSPALPPSPVASARQLLLVTTPSWDSTSGTLRRYVRAESGGTWQAVGADVPIVVGQTGLAWDDALRLAKPDEPVKHEGDGKSPAGAFALDTAFGFEMRQTVPWVRPCIWSAPRDDRVCNGRRGPGALQHDRGPQQCHARRLEERGADAPDRAVLPGRTPHNGAPLLSRGRGSCIFLHIWAGPRSVTAGCNGDGRQRPRGDRSVARPPAPADDRTTAARSARERPTSLGAKDIECASSMKRATVGFHRDDEGHWVAELACGHGQHVRHDPPWQTREWVTSEKDATPFSASSSSACCASRCSERASALGRRSRCRWLVEEDAYRPRH